MWKFDREENARRFESRVDSELGTRNLEPRERAMTWDLTSYFPEFNGAEMLQFKEALRQDANSDAWEGILLRHEDLLRRMSHLGSYVGCLASADARNEAYLKEEAALALLRAEIAKVKIELLRAVKNSGDSIFASFTARPSLAGAQNYLNRLRQEARRAMVPDKEVLATDLGVDGIQAWGRLYDTMASKLEFDMVYPDGRRERLPMSQRRSLMDHPDRGARKSAFDGGHCAWRPP